MERKDLASYASKSSQSKGRRYVEEFKDDRPAFERDRDRIIHCAAFRRLMYKTQVFVIHEGDYYRTRLTHSLEVAQIARGIARRLMLNEELSEAIALAHDLGHTPFGHAGEAALNKMMKGKGGFEHNLQSLRIVDKLEERYPNFSGLNLTWETREGLAKHITSYDQPFYNELKEYDMEKPPSLEAQVINFADEIAYNNHDIDDGLESGILNPEELETVPLWQMVINKVREKHPSLSARKLRYLSISSLIGLFITDLCENSLKKIKDNNIISTDDVRNYNTFLIGFSPYIEELNQQLKDFLLKKLYQHYRVERMHLKAERIITELFTAYRDNPSILPDSYQKRIKQEPKERVICDYIAGMTDRFAMEEYKRLFDPFYKLI
ncbi:MAG: deoxyguanosinetriphosphate triphosphohydrolase [Spirochaetes bacterium]|nr:MAG: deoxyguanosinetriphosphate triphosphohydrolase [Spirochaetota bacterium]